MDIYLATRNAHKVLELKDALSSTTFPVKVYSADAVGGMPFVMESEETFEENARLKAKALQFLVDDKAWVLADDSGICVDALRGAPGVYSSRYAGPQATDKQNYEKLLFDLKSVPEKERTAKVVCCLVFLNKAIGEVVFHGVLKGHIPLEPMGESDFGYDPIFMPIGYEQTFAQLGAEIKSRISHRALAVNELACWINEREKDFV